MPMMALRPTIAAEMLFENVSLQNSYIGIKIFRVPKVIALRGEALFFFEWGLMYFSCFQTL